MSTGFPQPSENWRELAACRDADPDLFFPIGTAGGALRQIDEAKQVCQRCLVRALCLAWAVDNRVTDGVWGRTTEQERRFADRLPGRVATSRNMEYARELR